MPKVIATKNIKLSSIEFHQEFYPRQKPSSTTIAHYVDALRDGGGFPPIKIDQDGNVLLDGYHRWKAYQEVGAETIEADIVDLEGFPRLLYSARENSTHGDRLTGKEKELVARSMAELDVKQADIKEALRVSAGTVSNWVGDITQRKQRSKEAGILWLGVLGWTQEEIADRAGLTQQAIAQILQKSSDLKKVVKSQFSRGRTVDEIAEAEGVTPKLIDMLLLNGKSDVARLEELKVGIQPYDVWNFSSCDPRFGFEYPGRVPGQIILHLLYLYTEQDDLVIDPMAGSGTTIDACAYMGRKVYGYDAHPIEARNDIIEHDFSTGWPDRIEKAKLVFFDPPYFKKKDADYGDKSISRLDKAGYLEFFGDIAQSIPRKFGGRLAFLCSDYNDDDDSGNNIFFWDYIEIFKKRGWKPERRIQIPLSTQSIHPDIVNKFRKAKRLARLNRDLAILTR